MAASKKTAKSKLISEDKGNKSQKREIAVEESEEEDMLFGQYKASLKKKKVEANVEDNMKSRQKILDLVGHQQEARKQWNKDLFKSLTEITTQVEADYNAMKENEQKLEHLTRAYLKCIQQATIAYQHKLKALQEIHSSFKKQYEDMESEHKEETSKLMDEVDYDIKKLQNKLITESKRSSWENVRRSILNAMQNDL